MKQGSRQPPSSGEAFRRGAPTPSDHSPATPEAENRFATRIDQLAGEQRAIAEAAVAAARSTFGAFAEKPGSEYHKAAGLTPEETWERVTEELARVSVLAAVEGALDSDLTADDIELIHRAIFEPVFGAESVGFRAKGDEVTYPVVLGTRDSPVAGEAHGVRYKQIRKRLKAALRDFARDLDGLEALDVQGAATLIDAIEPALKLYARVIRIHPFIDGNGRTAWAVFSYAMKRCGLPLVVLAPTDDTRWALGTAIRPGAKQDFRPLADIIADTIKRSAL